MAAWYRNCGGEWAEASVDGVGIKGYKMSLRMQHNEPVFSVEPVAGLASAATGDSWWLGKHVRLLSSPGRAATHAICAIYRVVLTKVVPVPYLVALAPLAKLQEAKATARGDLVLVTLGSLAGGRCSGAADADTLDGSEMVRACNATAEHANYPG